MSNQNGNVSEAAVIKDFVSKVLSLKYFYIACVVICLAIAYMFNKYSPVIYEVNSVIGPVEDKRSSMLSSDDLFRGFGGFGSDRNLENDINSLSSFSIIASTLNKMNLEIGYYLEQNVLFKHARQLYSGSPVTVSIDKSHIQPINARFYVEILDENTYRLTSSEEEVRLYNYIDNLVVSRDNTLEVDTICRFNETVNNNKFKFSVTLNRENYSGPKEDDERLFFEFYHMDELTKQYLGRVRVEPITLKSTLINVFFQGENITLTIDFLNKYLQTYLDDNLGKKNKISLNTVNFIDSQLSEISDSLVMSESRLKDYRSAHQVMDLSYQGQRAFEQMTQIETDRTNLQIQERYYNYILDYFNKNKDMAGLAPPSAANVSDPILNKLITDLLTLNAERSTLLSNNTEKSLFLGPIENQIKLQKQAIIENVSNNLNTLELSLNELNYRSDKLSKEISRLPRTELNMVSMQREFNLSDAIYTFLLQKRSEAAITMASNVPDFEILEPARSISRSVISPKKMLNWLIGLFMGLMIPTIFIILKNFFNEKITSVYDAERILNQPLFNVIYNNNYKSETVVPDKPDSAIAESFRNLRTSLFMKYKSESIKVILVTSSQPLDGKSFVAFNLAASIASVGYKTILIDCDLRRPTQHVKFKVDNTGGLTKYMTDHTPEDEIIVKTSIKNLSFIPAGPILPNPSELIQSGKLDELISYLKSKYDYVILDTTPAGLVSDATVLTRYSSINLLVIRNNYTRKDTFGDVLSMFETTHIDNFEVIYNDLEIKKSRYGRYNSYYRKK